MPTLNAVLLVGPTGAGKSPLGAYLETSGLAGRRCFHFDFGENLRSAAETPALYPLIGAPEIGIVRNSLATGALLEDNQFYIVKAIFESFARVRGIGAEDIVLLNGMPRHVGQAERIAEFIDVRLLVHLNCSDETVSRRIATNAGGDRTGRVDDGAAAVARKCETFRKRTVPLLTYYGAQTNTEIVSVPVDESTGPEAIAAAMEQALKGAKGW